MTNIFSLDGAILFTFTLSVSAEASVGILLIWHIYLCLTNQTTIEFYINYDEGRDAKAQGMVYKNPFDVGWRKNLRRVFGDVPLWRAGLLSFRPPVEPEYPLLPREIGTLIGNSNRLSPYLTQSLSTSSNSSSGNGSTNANASFVSSSVNSLTGGGGTGFTAMNISTTTQRGYSNGKNCIV
jgi:hypothetical protein